MTVSGIRTVEKLGPRVGGYPYPRGGRPAPSVPGMPALQQCVAWKMAGFHGLYGVSVCATLWREESE